MVWFLLSIFTTIGVSLIIMGYTSFNVFPPLILINLGGIIVLTSIWVGYRYWLSTRYKDIFIYLRGLYNDIGLFIKQYYDSESSHNIKKAKILHTKLKEYVPLLSRHEQSLSKKLLAEINTFFDMLLYYKIRIEGAVSYNRDGTAYRRWLEINTDFNNQVIPTMKRLKKKLCGLYLAPWRKGQV